MGTKHFSETTFLDVDFEDVEGLLAQPEGDDKPSDFLAQETVARRLRVAKVWNEFWKMMHRDPDQIWLDMCQPGPAQEQAIHYCRTFLRVYAEELVPQCS